MHDANPALGRIERRKIQPLALGGAVALVLALGLTISLAAFYFLNDYLRQHTKAEFQAHTHNYVHILAGTVSRYLEVVRTISGLLPASRNSFDQL